MFEIILTNGYAVSEYSKALAHLSYNNKQLSKTICKMAVENRYMSKNHADLVILRQQLKLEDADSETGELLQPKRLEWVFGCPQPINKALSEEERKERGESSKAAVEMGLEALKFNINGCAYDYIVALNEESPEDNLSVLKLLLKSYDIESLAKDEACAALEEPAEAAEESKEGSSAAAAGESSTKPTTAAAAVKAEAGTSTAEENGLEKSSMIDQLRVSRDSTSNFLLGAIFLEAFPLIEWHHYVT